MSPVKLRVISGSRAGEMVELAEGDEVFLGRDPACDLDLGDPKASRRHCVLRCRDGRLEVEDLRSSNGTWVNGERVERRRLGPEDVLRVGDSVLELAGRAAAVPGAAKQRSTGPSAARRRLRRAAPLLVFVAACGGLAALLHAFLANRESPGDVARTSEARESAAGGTTGEAAISDDVPGGSLAGGDEPEDVASPPRGDPAGGVERSPAVDSPAGPPAADAGLDGAGDDFRGRLRDLEARSRELTPAAFQEEARRILAAARDRLDETVDGARDLVRRGDYGGGRQLILDLLPRLPEMLHRSAYTELERLGELERERREGGALTPDDPAFAVKAAIARCRFADAARLASRLETSAGGESAEELEADARAAGAAWRRLQAAFGALAAEGASARLEWEPARARVVIDGGSFGRGAPPPGGEMAVLGLEDTRLRLRDRAGERLEDVFTLEDATLIRILEESGSTGPPLDEDILRGLGLIVLYREGPRRARSFAGVAFGGEAARSGSNRLRFLERAERERETWLLIRRSEIESGAERFRAETVPGDLARELAVGAAELLVLWSGRPSFSGARAGLIDLYRRARRPSLERGGAADGGNVFFHAGEVEMAGGRVRLRYDFTSRSELDDIVAVGEESVREISRRQLALRGECRFLGGHPFGSPLAVRLRLPGNGYSPSAPNINVALWTSEGVAVSPAGPFTLTRSLLTGGADEAGYVVCATGYRTAVSDYGGKKLEEVRPAGSKDFIPLPAHVLFAGLPGRPLHTDPSECVWARPIGPAGLRGSLAIDIAAGETLEWKVNGETVTPRETAALERLRPPERRAGSVSIFTCGRELRIDEIEIEAALDGAWLDARIEEHLEREVRELLR